MKPSERITILTGNVREYESLLDQMIGVLDDMHEQIKELRENQQRCFCEQCKADRS